MNTTPDWTIQAFTELFEHFVELFGLHTVLTGEVVLGFKATFQLGQALRAQIDARQGGLDRGAGLVAIDRRLVEQIGGGCPRAP